MNYRLIHKKLGVKSLDVFSEFEYPHHIKDICFVKDVGFFYIGNQSLFLNKDKQCQEIMTLDNPMSICSENFNIYVSYNKGIKSINCSDNYYSIDVLSSIEYKKIFGGLEKIGIKDVYIDVYNGIIGIALTHLHKIYRYQRGSVDMIFGTGVPEYSISSKINNCSISSPQGILVYDNDTLFVSDTGNGCIRSFGEIHRMITGHPMSNVLNPTKLLLNRRRNCLCYLSKNYLRSVNVDGTNDVLLYEGNKIKSIAQTHDEKIYMLEEIDE